MHYKLPALWLQTTQRMGMSLGILLIAEHCPARCLSHSWSLSKPPYFHMASHMTNNPLFLVSLTFTCIVSDSAFVGLLV